MRILGLLVWANYDYNESLISIHHRQTELFVVAVRNLSVFSETFLMRVPIALFSFHFTVEFFFKWIYEFKFQIMNSYLLRMN